MEYVRTTFAQLFFHSGQLEELRSIDQEVTSRNIEELNIPNGVFGFRFVDIITASIEIDGTIVKLTSEPINLSVMYYWGGDVIGEDEARQSGDIVLLAYIGEQDCGRAIKVRKDILMPFHDGDVRLEPKMVPRC